MLKVAALEDRLVEKAIDIRTRYDLQFYDSLLLATAEANGCDEFWSEDLNDGQIYCGMKAVNPFKGREYLPSGASRAAVARGVRDAQ